jgi:cell division protein FtsB
VSGTTRSSGRTPTRRPAPKGARPAADRVQPAPRWVRYSIFGLAGLLVVGLLAYFFPVRTYLDQQHRISVAEQRLRIIDQQTATLEAQRKAAEAPSEIVRIARDRFGMVKPGEQPWAVVPGASTTTTTAPGAVVPGR